MFTLSCGQALNSCIYNPLLAPEQPSWLFLPTTMSPSSYRNAEYIDSFTQHMLDLYTSQLSHRTSAAPLENSNGQPKTSSVAPHECQEICCPIIDGLVSAFLNPGMCRSLDVTMTYLKQCLLRGTSSFTKKSVPSARYGVVCRRKNLI